MDCLHPIWLKSGDLVPCGRCPRCRRNRQRDWTLRLRAERDAADFTLWLTLTIAPEYMDTLPDQTMCLSKEKPRHFFESLRKHYGSKVVFKHYLVSEYGDGTDRPHFHCLLFGYVPGAAPLDVLKTKNDVVDFITREGSTCWPYGFAYNKPLHFRVFGYITNYINKPELVDPEHPHPVRPFTCISQGIGESYMQRFDKSQFANYEFVISDDGSKKVLPRYYRDKILPRSLDAARKALDRGDIETFDKIMRNRTEFDQVMRTQIYPAKISNATRQMLRFEKDHKIDYARYLDSVAQEEDRQYKKQLQKRKSL